MDYSTGEDQKLALWSIAEKLPIIGNVQDSRKEHILALSAVAEACWWIASLDEHLEKNSGYTDARDADPRGYPILGIRWARHRHSHDLLTTSRGHVQPFLSDEPSGVIFISKPYQWRTVESMHLTGKSATRSPDLRARYVEVLEGNEVHASLVGALGWLTEAAAT